MHILVIGARGLIARHLRRWLLQRGHTLTTITRCAKLSAMGPEEELLTWHCIAKRGLPPCDALVSLTGAPIASKRWTRRTKQEHLATRVGVIHRIEILMRAMPRPPKRAVIATAVGIYPATPTCTWDEQPPLIAPERGDQSQFLRWLGHQWEAAAQTLETHCPVTCLRLGAVLATDGGMIDKLSPWFRKGLGIGFGEGTNPFPWIHIRDACQIATFALETDVAGPINCVAPDLVDLKTFIQSLAGAFGKRVLCRISPRWLRWLLGERAALLLEGPRVCPKRLTSLNYSYAFPRLKTALAECCGIATTSI